MNHDKFKRKISHDLVVHVEICLILYVLDSRGGHFGNMLIKKKATTFIKCYHAEIESRGPADSKNVKTSQAYFFEGFILFFEDFSLTSKVVCFTDFLYFAIGMDLVSKFHKRKSNVRL